MKKLKKDIEIIVEVTKTGYSAYATTMDVFTTGKTSKELYTHLLEAINLALEEDGYEATLENLKVQLDFKQFFQYYKVLNAKFLAERIGMNPTLLSQYVNGKKQPSSKQSEKIINGIQGIGKELSDLHLV